jgi:hypothetical protein
VRRIALSLPETSEQLSRGLRQWRVKDKGFVWQRPLRRGDLEALGDMARTGRSWAHAWNIRAKEALLVDDRNIYFSTPHFDGYPAIFVRLYRIGLEDLARAHCRSVARASPGAADQDVRRRGPVNSAPISRASYCGFNPPRKAVRTTTPGLAAPCGRPC